MRKAFVVSAEITRSEAIIVKGEEALEEFVSKYRSSSGEADVLVGFSGGRDSSYGLDYIKNQLGLASYNFHLRLGNG